MWQATTCPKPKTQKRSHVAQPKTERIINHVAKFVCLTNYRQLHRYNKIFEFDSSLFFSPGFIVNHKERATIAVTLATPKCLLPIHNQAYSFTSLWVDAYVGMQLKNLSQILGVGVHAFNFKIQRPMWYLMHAIKLPQWTLSDSQALIDEALLLCLFAKAEKKIERPLDCMIIHSPREQGGLQNSIYLTWILKETSMILRLPNYTLMGPQLSWASYDQSPVTRLQRSVVVTPTLMLWDELN